MARMPIVSCEFCPHTRSNEFTHSWIYDLHSGTKICVFVSNLYCRCARPHGSPKQIPAL